MRRVMVNGAGKVVRETSGRRDVAGYVWHRSTRLPHWQILIGTRYVTSQNEHTLRHTLDTCTHALCELGTVDERVNGRDPAGRVKARTAAAKPGTMTQ